MGNLDESSWSLVKDRYQWDSLGLFLASKNVEDMGELCAA